MCWYNWLLVQDLQLAGQFRVGPRWILVRFPVSLAGCYIGVAQQSLYTFVGLDHPDKQLTQERT
jgi:hypothetical protein